MHHHRGEPRVAMAAAVLVAIVLHLTLPSALRLGQPWLYPSIAVGLLLVLVIGDPGRIDKPDRWLRVVTSALIAAITIDNAFQRHPLGSADHHQRQARRWRPTAGQRCSHLAHQRHRVRPLVLGPRPRWGRRTPATGTVKLHAFVFPEMNNPEWVKAGWYPSLVDYLHMLFVVSTVFSPTDVSAIKHWSKMLMTLQSAVSLLLAVLVIARAINILPG